MRYMLLATSFLVTVLVSSSIVPKEISPSLLIQLPERNSSTVMKKVRIGMVNSVLFQLLMKNAEQTLAVFIFAPDQKYTHYFHLKRVRLKLCSGLM
jgi:hypothetical protein